MRFPLAALFFIVLSFIFFVFFVYGSVITNEMFNAMNEHADDLDPKFGEEITLLKDAFAVIAAIFFVVGIIALFVLDSLSEDAEYYYRR